MWDKGATPSRTQMGSFQIEVRGVDGLWRQVLWIKGNQGNAWHNKRAILKVSIFLNYHSFIPVPPQKIAFLPFYKIVLRSNNAAFNFGSSLCSCTVLRLFLISCEGPHLIGQLSLLSDLPSPASSNDTSRCFYEQIDLGSCNVAINFGSCLFSCLVVHVRFISLERPSYMYPSSLISDFTAALHPQIMILVAFMSK